MSHTQQHITLATPITDIFMYFYLYNGFTSNHTNITEWPWSNAFNECDIVVNNDHYIFSPPYLLHETLGNLNAHSVQFAQICESGIDARCYNGENYSPELEEPTIKLIPRCRNFFVTKNAKFGCSGPATDSLSAIQK